VKINYSDIGSIAGKTKDYSRIAIERVIRNMSDKIKRGEDANVEIPLVGNFVCKNRIVAVVFD
jgi:hypothetical protein